MKIALYVNSWPGGAAATGIVTYTSQLVPALRRLGHEVFVVTSNPTGASPDDHTVDLRTFSRRPRLWDRALWRLAPARSRYRAIAETVADAVEMLVRRHGVQVFEMEESFGWALATLRRDLLPVVVRLHGPWFLTGTFNDPGEDASANRGRVELEGEAIAAASIVSANCVDTLRRVRSHYGLELLHSRIVPTPLDPADASQTWRLDGCERGTILFVGRFDRLKGADIVLRAFEQLATESPHLRLTFVGPDRGLVMPDGSTLNFEQYVREHHSLALRSRIDFKGRTEHADVMRLRERHHVTVIAAQFDTFGYMLLEPMSLGCPIVTTAVGGIPEVIRDRENGLLVPTQDADAMAAACRAVLADDGLAARVGRQAWTECAQKYSADAVARQMSAMYQAAIDRFRVD